MITEKGTIKVTTETGVKVQKELSKTFMLVGVITLALGCLGIAVYLAFSILSVFGIGKEPSLFYLLPPAVLFAFGLVLVVTCRKLVKQARSTPARVEECEFFSDCIIANDFLNGENIGTGRFLYKQIVNRRETANYIFFYLDNAVATPLEKNGLDEKEINTLRALVGLGTNGETLRLPAYESDAANGADPQEVKPVTETGEQTAADGENVQNGQAG